MNNIFQVLAVAFDKIPFLSKFKGYRTVLGLLGLAVLGVLRLKGIGDPTVMESLNISLLGFTGLALNSKQIK